MVGAWHLTNNPRDFELSRNNMFELVVYDIDELLRAGATTKEYDDFIRNGQDRIRLSVTRASIPNFTQGKIEINRGNTTMKAAGVMSFSDGSLEVNDYIGADPRAVLLAWQRLSGDIVTEAVGRMVDYKKNCTLIEYTSDGEVVRYWDIQGAWLSEVNIGDWNMDSGNQKRTISATVVYDRAIPHEAD